jgi:hypothetical protein
MGGYMGRYMGVHIVHECPRIHAMDSAGDSMGVQD